MPIGCCSAICPACRCRMSSCRSPATGSGRRPTGPGPAASSTCCCRACISACRSWRASSTSSIRRKPSGSWRTMASATPSCRRRRCACCAPSPTRAAASTLTLRTIALRRRGARRRDLRVGPRGARAFDQRVLRPDRVQSGARLLRGDRRRASRARSGEPVPGHQVGVIREDGTVCEPGELGQIAVLRPDPGDVPVLLEQARRDARRNSSATG